METVHSQIYTMNSTTPMNSLKLVILGQPAVGKTSLRRSILGKEYRRNYNPTLGADFSQKILPLTTGKCQVNLWDLSGQQRFKDVQPQYYVGSHAAIVVYEIEEENYLEDIINWIDRYIEYSGNYDIPLMLVQNKIDLQKDNDEIQSIKKHEELIERLNIYYHNKLQIIGYRTSAKTGENVKNSFINFVERVLDDHLNSSSSRLRLTNQIYDGMYCKSSYLMTFDEKYGPVILSKSPNAGQLNVSMKELSDSVRLYSGLNFEDLIGRGFRTGRSPWPGEKCMIYYIAFSIENEKIRGGYELFIIGIAIPDDLSTLVGDSNTYIEGYLLNSMNNLEETLHDFEAEVELDEDFISVTTNDLDIARITKVLYQLRLNVDSLIQDLL